MKRLVWLSKKLLSYFPTKLPVGLPQFQIWVDDVIELSGQFADRTSMEFVLASELLHSDAKKGLVPKNYFVSRCRKLAANQTASYVLQEIKASQAAQKAEEDANKAALKLAEDTGSLGAPSANEKITV